MTGLPDTARLDRFRGVCYLHVGTHKTGTTSIQRSLTANERLLAQIGFTVPRAGRSGPDDGHHNIAWECGDDPRFDRRRGSLDDVLGEVAAAGRTRAIVSSEDFEYLGARPDRLRRVADAFAAIGFAVAPVIYLRPQAGYAESLYAELVKHGLTVPFHAFLDTILATGEYRFNRWCFTFDYARLVDGFTAVFDPRRTIVRAYADKRDDVVADFLRAVGADALIASNERVRPPRLNSAASSARVFEQLQRNAARDAAEAPSAAGSVHPSAAGAFDPIDLHDAFRLTSRFNAGNRRLFARYRVAIPCVSGADVCGDLATACGIDAGGRLRRQLIVAHSPRAARPRLRTSAVASQPSRPRGPGRFWRRLKRAPAIVAARREAIAIVAAFVGSWALIVGQLTQRTALTEFGLLSVLTAATAAARLVRCAVAAYGTLVDERFFAAWALRLTMAGYGFVALYAAVNALLDVGVPRNGPDLMSLGGAAAVVLAVAALRIAGASPTGVPRELGASPVFARPSGEYALIAFGCVALALEPLHAVRPVWWLDTIVDALAVAAAWWQYHVLWRRLGARDARAYLRLSGEFADVHV